MATDRPDNQPPDPDEQLPPIITDAMAAAGWTEPIHPELPPVTLLMNGDHGLYQVALLPDESGLTCEIVSALPSTFGEPDPSLYEALNLANGSVIHGRFILDTRDGPELGFSDRLPFLGATVRTEAAELMVWAGVDLMDVFLPSLLAVARGECTPEDAIAMAERRFDEKLAISRGWNGE